MSSKKNNNKSSFEDIDKLIDNTFLRLKDVIDANTVVGSTIKLTEKIFIVPISKVSVGLVSGGGEVPNKKNDTSNACSTTGFTITPMGFITINNSAVDFISSNIADNSGDKLLDVFSISPE